MVSGAVSTSLVPYKSLCWCPANFTPDVMQSAIRSPIALLTDTNVNICFQHLLVNFTRLLSLVYSIQLINTHLRKSLFPFFLIVHHQKSFRSQQHKVICKLSLTIVCGRPFLLILVIHWPVRFARLPHEGNFVQSLPSFVQHLCPYKWA